MSPWTLALAMLSFAAPVPKPGVLPPAPRDPRTQAILAAVAPRLEALRGCVNAPQLPPISVKLSIAPSGRVAAIEVMPSEYEHGSVSACLREGLSGLAFEPAEKETTLELPLNLGRVYTVTSRPPAQPRLPPHPFVRSFKPTARGASISVPVGAAATGRAELVLPADEATRPARERLAAGDPNGAVLLLEPCVASAAPSEACLALQIVALVYRDESGDLNQALQVHQRLRASFPTSPATPAVDQLVQIELR